jgi:hypothetical protein
MKIANIATTVIGAINEAKAGTSRGVWTLVHETRISPMSNGRSRFQLGGITGFIAVRKKKSRGYCVQDGRTFTQIHLGKVSIGFEKDCPERLTWNFAGNYDA